jgi:hypothetical protein
MNNEKQKQKVKPGIIVEDAGLAGGINEAGEDVVVPKQQDGKARPGVKTTDKREQAEAPKDE